MQLGIVLIFLGLILLPAGVKYLLDEYRDYKELNPNRRFLVYLFEVINFFTGGSLSTWLLSISLLLIIGGAFMIQNSI